MSSIIHQSSSSTWLTDDGSIFQPFLISKLSVIGLITKKSFVSFISLYVILTAVGWAPISACRANEHLEIDKRQTQYIILLFLQTQSNEINVTNWIRASSRISCQTWEHFSARHTSNVTWNMCLIKIVTSFIVCSHLVAWLARFPSDPPTTNCKDNFYPTKPFGHQRAKPRN